MSPLFYPCSYPGCRELLPRSGKCQRHKREARRQDYRSREQALYSSARWRKMRASFLNAHPLCAICEREGRPVTPATQLDHIRPVSAGGDVWNPENLQGACASCHAKKTRQEQLSGGVGKPIGEPKTWRIF